MSAADLVEFALGCVIIAFGVACLAGHLLRPKPRDRLLLWIGSFAVCYGGRMLISLDRVGAIVFTEEQGAFVVAALNYWILIPAILFTEELYGRGWHDLVRWLTMAIAVYAVGGVIVDIVTGDPNAAPDPALILLVPGMAVVFVAGWLAGYRPRPFPEWRILLGGFAVFILFVVHEHAVAARLVPWRVRVEPLGMLLFNATLAYIAVSRFFTTQRQLITVEKEMDAARQIQASILPRELPATAGVDIAVRYRPLAAVAGDFYDVVPLAGGAVAVLVADVSGHGVPAALIASMVKVAFAAETGRTDDPGSVLHGMNATLCGMFERAYVTAVCATIDPTRRSIAYAIAGHPPPLLVRRDGRVERLDERGMFIGMFPLATYTSAVIPVNGGARLILYTDGITEAARPGSDELFGIERLTTFARHSPRTTAAEFATALLDHVAVFAQQRSLTHDDVTLMIVDVE